MPVLGIGYLMMQQREWIAEANGTAPLSRWQTPFSMDVAFGADARAWVYDSHLLPTWKRPGHWSHWLTDRGNALGTYSSLMLAMSHLLMSTKAVDKVHEQLLPPATEQGPVGAGNEPMRDAVLEFLRDQGFAAHLGFRRAWPTSRHALMRPIASQEDIAFARLLDELGLLLPSLDALKGSEYERRRADLLRAQAGALWPFRGVLYSNRSKPVRCEDAQRIVDSWGP